MADLQGSWYLSGTGTTKTAKYMVGGNTIAEITGLSSACTKDALAEVTTDPTTDDDGSVKEKGSIALTADMLTTSTVKLSKGSASYEISYTGALDSDGIEAWETKEAWAFSGGTATYKTVKPSYYTIDTKGTTITYVKEKDITTLAKISGLNKNLAVDPDDGNIKETVTTKDNSGKSVTNFIEDAEAVIEDVSNTGGVITLKAGALGTSAITLTQGQGKDEDGNAITYTLAIDGADENTGVLGGKGEDAKEDWSWNGSVATYKIDVPESWTLDNDENSKTYGTKITYAAPSTEVLATISGLAKGIDVYDLNGLKEAIGDDPTTTKVDESHEAVSASITVEESDGAYVFILSKKLLGTSKVTVTKGKNAGNDDTFALKLGEDVTTTTEAADEDEEDSPPAAINVWRLNGTTATYKAVIPEYYTVEDGAIVYHKEADATDDNGKAIVYATISGLSKNVKLGTADDLDSEGVSLEEQLFASVTTGTGSDAVTTNYAVIKEFTLATDDTFKAVYVKDEENGKDTEEIDYYSGTGTITLNKLALGTTNVVVKGTARDYKLAIDTEATDENLKVEAPTVKEDSTKWTVKSGTATMTGVITTEGYALTADEKTIAYKAASKKSGKNYTPETLLTITGLDKTKIKDTTKAQTDAPKDITLTDNIVKVSADVITTSNVVVKEKTYQLAALTSESGIPVGQKPDGADEEDTTLEAPAAIDVWRFNNGTATYKSVIPEWYEYDAEKNSYIYHKEEDNKDSKNKAIVYAVVTGLTTKITSGKTTTPINYSVVDVGTDGAESSTLKCKVGTEGEEVNVFGAIELKAVDSEGEEVSLDSDDFDETFDHYTGTVAITEEAINAGVVGTSIKLDQKKYAGFTLAFDKAEDYTYGLKKDTEGKWEVKGTTATFSGITDDGYSVTNGEIKKIAGSGTKEVVIATIKDIASGLNAGANKSFIGIDADEENEISETKYIYIDEGQIKISEEVLNQKTITLTTDAGYVFEFEDKVAAEDDGTGKIWKLNGTTATLYSGTTEGYTLEADGEDGTVNPKSGLQITYTAPVYDEVLATITGLKKGVTLSDLNNSELVSVEDTTITLSEAVLGTDVSVSEGYTLELAEGVTKPEDETEFWVVNGTTANLYKAISAGWALDKTEGSSTKGHIVYKPASYTANDLLATVTGLVSGGVVATDDEGNSIIQYTDKKTKVTSTGVTYAGTVITLNHYALGTGTMEVKTGAGVEEEAVYTLALDETDNEITKSTKNDEKSKWSVKTAGTAIYTEKVTAGYNPVNTATGEDSEPQITKITYIKKDTDVVTSISNLNAKKVKISAVKNGEIVGIEFKDGVITINEDLLSEKTVSLAKTSDYTLKVAASTDDAENSQIATTEQEATWTKTANDNKAIYGIKTTAGYSLSEDGKSIVYSKDPTVKALATVTGLKKEITVTDLTDEVIVVADSEDDKPGTITITSKNILAGTNVTLGNNDNYTLELEGEFEAKEVASYWTFSGGTASLVSGTDAGYIKQDEENNKVIICEEPADVSAVAIIKGLNKNLKTDITGEKLGVETTDDGETTTVTEAVSIEDNSITVNAAALGNSNVTIENKGNSEYTLALGEDVTSKADENGDAPEAKYAWSVSGTTATYKKVTPAYYSEEEGKIVYHAETDEKSVIATITGLKKGIEICSDATDDNYGKLGIYVTDENGDTTFVLALNNDEKFKYEEPEEDAEESTTPEPLTVTLNEAVLGEGTIQLKSNSPALAVCTLDLNDDVKAPEINSGKWTKDSSKKTATLTGNVTAGWTLDPANNKINYAKPQNKVTLATMTGVTGTISGGESSAEIITLDTANLTKTKVTLKDTLGLGYGLSLATAAAAETKAATWNKKTTDTKATYEQTTDAGYSQDGLYTINYSAKATTKVLATITGLQKGLSAADLAEGIQIGANDIEGGLSVMSLSSGLFADSEVKLGSKDQYGFKLTDAETAAIQADGAHWVVDKGTATIVEGTSKGWAIKQTKGADTPEDDTDDEYDYKTIAYTKPSYTTYATVKGLNKDSLQAGTGEKGNEIYLVTGVDDEGEPTLSEEAALKFELTGESASLGGTISINNKDALIKKTNVTITTPAKGLAEGAGYSFAAPENIGTASFGGESENPAKWYINGTTAYLKSGTSDGWTYKDNTPKNLTDDDYDKKTLSYVAEAPVANSLASATITGLKSGLVVDGGGSIIQYKITSGANKGSYSSGITVDETGVISILSKEVLGTTTVSIASASGANYAFSEELNFAGLSIPKAGFSAPTWNVSKGTATLLQKTTAGFSLENENTVLRYTAASKNATAGDAVLTISGLDKNIASVTGAEYGGVSGISFTYTEGGVSSGTVITLGNEVLGGADGGAKITIKSSDKTKNYSLSLAEDVAGSASSVTEWSGTGTLTYKSYDKGYYTYASVKGAGGSFVEDRTTINYNKEANIVSHSTITGLKSNVTADTVSDEIFDKKTKVFKLSSAQLDKKAVKITGDAFTLDTSGITSELSAVSVKGGGTGWSMNGTTATFKAIRTKGYSLSEDGKTLSYLSANSKEQAIATITNLNSSASEITAEMISSSGGMSIITLNDDYLLDKTVVIKGDGYGLSYAGELASSIMANSTTWTVKDGTATLGGRLTEGYTVSADKKSIVYTAQTGRGNTVNFTTIKGLNSDIEEKNLENVFEEENKTITFEGTQLDEEGVTLGGGDFTFAFTKYDNGSIIGSANADIIHAGGASILVNAGKGDDVVDFGNSAGGVFVYASGDGNDTVTGASVINLGSTAITAQNFKVDGEDVILVVGKGSINLGAVASDGISVIHKNSAKEKDGTVTPTVFVADDKYGIVEQPANEDEEASVGGRAAPDVENILTPFMSSNYDTSAQLDSIIKPVDNAYVFEDSESSLTSTNLDSQGDAIAYGGDDKK